MTKPTLGTVSVGMTLTQDAVNEKQKNADVAVFAYDGKQSRVTSITVGQAIVLYYQLEVILTELGAINFEEDQLPGEEPCTLN